MPTTDTLVFIPAWNEEENLPAVLDELRATLPDVTVLVVDDGSTDASAAVAKEHGAEVLSFGENRGLQQGIAAGYRHALEQGYAFCGRVDADGQHPASELARLLGRVREGRAMKLALGRPFGDATSGMTAANAAALPYLAEPYTTGAPEVQALLRLHEAGLRVEEVPVDMRERASGESKLQGKKAFRLVLTVAGTLLAFTILRRRRGR
jgi:glycosyltransferase involved in cell wall biosynthesis